MPKYTYLACDLLTGVVRDEIPFSSITYSSEMSKPGGFDATVSIDPVQPSPVNGLTAPKRVTLANLAPARTALWVLRGGTPVFGGIIWAFQADLNSRTVRFAGQDFLSYFGRRTINETKSYPGIEQFGIVSSLINYAQGQLGGDIGMTVEWGLDGDGSNVNRERTYYNFEHANVLEAITQLGNVDNGFDFLMEFGGSQATGLTSTLRLYYPYAGRATPIILDARKNVRLLGWEQDGMKMTTTQWSLGAGDGDNMIQASDSNPDALAAYPLLESVSSYKDVSVQATIQDHATQDLRLASRPVEAVTLEIDPNDQEGGLGTFILGDQMRVIASDGFIDIDQQMRARSRSVSVDENGLEVMRVEMASLEGTV